VEALKSGKIAGAGFDVYLTEPLPPDENSFGEMENVVLQPHAGGVTAESSERSNRAPVDNVIAFLEGRPVNVVKPGHSSGALAHSRYCWRIRRSIRLTISKLGHGAR
jgi:phosphoglycerate dehydrogenase-like enzyme